MSLISIYHSHVHKGNTHEPITAIQHQFCEVVAKVHEDFTKMPHLVDVKLRFVVLLVMF